MFRRTDRYLNWLEPWPSVAAPLSAEGQQTLKLAQACQEGAELEFDDPSPEIRERKRIWLTERINRAAPDMRTLQTWEDAFQHFGVRRKGRRDVNDACFIRTFVWQTVVRILEGQERPIRGNLRSAWYRELRLVLFRLKLLEWDQEPGDGVQPGHYRGNYLLKVMEKAFQEMFLAGFFRYQDLQVYDARENFWVLGTSRAAIVFFTEKEGLFWLCRELQAQFGVTVMASRGSPIWITMDYLIANLKRRGITNARIVCLTDYDPWGYDMGRQMKEKFSDPVFGLRSVRVDVLTDLSLFTPERIQTAKRYLLIGHQDPNDPTYRFVMDWVAETGGIASEPYGIHVDHAEPHLVVEAFRRWLGPDAGLEVRRKRTPRRRVVARGRRS